MKLKHLLLILLVISSIGLIWMAQYKMNRPVSVIEQERIEQNDE